VDIDTGAFAAKPSVDLSLGVAELAPLALAASHDPDLVALISGVKAFRLRQYAATDDTTASSARKLMEDLEADGWTKAREEDRGDQQVCIYTRTQDETIAGLTVISIRPGHLVAIANVVGNIPPDQLERLGLPIAP
ncbi:DUF4252 domain-containing protein, partial [Candidatus Latescibacterota bacterium]